MNPGAVCIFLSCSAFIAFTNQKTLGVGIEVSQEH